jgi:hypothetical protein
LLCAHTEEPSLADICIVLTHVQAELIESPHTGKQHAVLTCPHCERTHRHAPTPGRHHRISSCGKPYIVHLAETAVVIDQDTERTATHNIARYQPAGEAPGQPADLI